MARYLVVAHQTATSPLLLARVEELARDDPHAEFVVLVPETHVSHLLVCDEVETRALAARRAAEAADEFSARGLRLLRTEVGSSSPALAIADEFRRVPEYYDAIVLSTLRSGISRWLRMDVPRRVAAEHHVPVLHVAEGAEAAWTSTAQLRRELARGKPLPREGASPKPSLLEQSRWYLALALGLVSLHALLMTALALRTDMRFVAVEVLVLALFLVMLLIGWLTSQSVQPTEQVERGS